MSDEKTTIQVHFPPGHLGASAGDDWLDTALRVIAVAFGPPDDWTDKYGCDYDNDVFTMRQQYWGDCVCGFDERREAWHEANPHNADCYQRALFAEVDLSTEARRALARYLCQKHGIPWNDGKACMVHCTCDWNARWDAFIASDDHGPECPIDKPNFLYKPTGFAVEWYKYIGRDTEMVGAPPLDMLERIFASHPTGMTIGAALDELVRRTDATQRGWSAMMALLNARARS